jgi:hypothetical protein
VDDRRSTAGSQKPVTSPVVFTPLFQRIPMFGTGTIRLTLPVRGLLESSDRETKRDPATFISTELAFKSGWGIRYAFFSGQPFCEGKF